MFFLSRTLIIYASLINLVLTVLAAQMRILYLLEIVFAKYYLSFSYAECVGTLTLIGAVWTLDLVRWLLFLPCFISYSYLPPNIGSYSYRMETLTFREHVQIFFRLNRGRFQHILKYPCPNYSSPGYTSSTVTWLHLGLKW